MKILFVGGYNPYTRLLGAKLAKNGLRFAVLNGESKEPQLPRHAHFAMETRYIASVLKSCRPDAVVVTAAYDEGPYLNGLEHVLTACAAADHKRLIFLSSLDVYGTPGETRLPTEADIPRPADPSGLRFALGEDMCRRYETAGLKTAILRLGPCYGENAPDTPLNALLSRLQAGEALPLPRAGLYAPLHLEDMAEAVLQVLEAGYSPIYNLCASQVFTAEALAACLQGATGTGNILLNEEAPSCKAADNARFKSEYAWLERHSFESELPLIAKVQAASRAQTTQKKQRLSTTYALRTGWRGYAETILLFALAALATLSQSAIPLIAEVNFLALYVVLIALTMTLHQTALGLLLACALLVFEKTREGYDIFSAILHYRTLLKAAEYALIGVGVSYIIQWFKMRMYFMKLEKKELQNEIKALRQINGENLASRQDFEDQILTYETSLPRVTALAARLDSQDTGRILAEALDILSETLSVEAVAVYAADPGGRLRLIAAHSERTNTGSARARAEYPRLLSTLETEQVFVNRALDPRYPSLASGVKLEGRLAFAFLIWDVPFGRMRLDTVNLLQALTQLVCAALRRAAAFERSARCEQTIAPAPMEAGL